MIEYIEPTIAVPKGYLPIVRACLAALTRAAVTKGRARHADHDNQPLMDQDIARYSDGFRIDQIRKKAQEAGRFIESRRKYQLQKAFDELADVIVYASVQMELLNARMLAFPKKGLDRIPKGGDTDGQSDTR
jgi:hypothetical protein